MLLLLALAGCNQYQMFRVTGYEQVGFSNDADILFVVDNSNSMVDEAAALAFNFNTFINQLTNAEEGSNIARETLSDALDNYLRETSGQNMVIDYQLGITTSSVDFTAGGTPELEPGEGGLMVGDIVDRNNVNASFAFKQQALCLATCWNVSDLEVDPDFVCPADPATARLPSPEDISEDYLNCVCGVDGWKDHCGAGNEEPIEAAWLALCRALEDPPEACYEDFSNGGATPFQPGDELSNAGFLREGATTVVVVVTDEGDGSRRLDTGDDEVEAYLDLFQLLDNVVRFAVIGPGYFDGSLPCNSGGAQPWAVERYQNLVEETGGVYVNIENETNSGDCASADFAAALSQIGTLLNDLTTIFTLQVVPDTQSIEVYIDDEPIEELTEAPASRSDCKDEAAEAGLNDDGWIYDPAYNAVVFYCDEVPDFNADVRIYYRPLGGNPRELPF